MDGYDCIQIPGAENAAGVDKPPSICGHDKGLVTAVAGTVTVCCKLLPLQNVGNELKQRVVIF